VLTEAILIVDAQSRERAYARRALAESQKAAGSDGSEIFVLRKIKG